LGGARRAAAMDDALAKTIMTRPILSNKLRQPTRGGKRRVFVLPSIVLLATLHRSIRPAEFPPLHISCYKLEQTSRGNKLEIFCTSSV